MSDVPPSSHGPDSFTQGLTTAVRSRKGRTLTAAAWPWLRLALVAAGGWVASKADSKDELAQAVAVRAELKALNEQVAELVVTVKDHPVRVKQLERGQYFAWRALAEVRAATYAGETAKKRLLMDQLGAKFAASFDKRALRDPPEVAYDEVFAKANVE